MSTVDLSKQHDVAKGYWFEFNHYAPEHDFPIGVEPRESTLFRSAQTVFISDRSI